MNFICLLEYALLLASTIAQPTSSFEGTLLRARQIHETSALPLLIYFSSEDCTSCAEFDALFEQPDILQKMETHYVSVHVSIDDFDGKACADIYHVQNVPAFVIADHEGVILYKSDETLSVQDIRLLLESVPAKYPSVSKENITEDGHESSSSTTSAPANEITGTTVEMTSFESVKSPLISQDNTESAIPVVSESAGMHVTATQNTPTREEGTSNSQSDFSELSISSSLTPELDQSNSSEASTPSVDAVPTPSRSMYAIQLGFFSDKTNATSLMKKAHQKDLTEARVETVTREGKPFFRVLVGSFSSLSAAQSQLDQVVSKGLHGVVHRW